MPGARDELLANTAACFYQYTLKVGVILSSIVHIQSTKFFLRGTVDQEANEWKPADLT